LGFKRTVQNDEAQDASRRGASLMVVLQRVLYAAGAVSLPVSHSGEVKQDCMAKFCSNRFFGMLMESMLTLKLTDGYFTFGKINPGMCFVIA